MTFIILENCRFLLCSTQWTSLNLIYFSHFQKKADLVWWKEFRPVLRILSVPPMGEILYFGLWITIHDEFRDRSPNSAWMIIHKPKYKISTTRWMDKIRWIGLSLCTSDCRWQVHWQPLYSLWLYLHLYHYLCYYFVIILFCLLVDFFHSVFVILNVILTIHLLIYCLISLYSLIFYHLLCYHDSMLTKIFSCKL